LAGVRRPRRHLEAAPDNRRSSDIEGGLDPVGDEHVGIPEQPGHNLGGGDDEIDGQSEQGHTRTALQIAGGNVRCRVQRRGHSVRKSISAAVYETHGNPADVLRLEEQPWPTAGPGQVVVKIRAAPINPADLNMIEGKYPGPA